MQVAHPLGTLDTRSASFTSGASAPPPPMYNSSQHGMTTQAGAWRSFPEANGMSHVMEKPQIYTAVYSGVSVYEMEIHGVAVMRRRSDSWLNATQILKVAGVDKGKRTKVLEKEILIGEHEKVQGGYGKYQGTWINYRRGREFCRQYGVEELLRPLLEYDMGADGTGQPGQGIDTPTKEQAQAANRKRLYTATVDPRANSQNANGTFFSNISSTASNAIAAMNKVARLNSPAPRPGSAQRRPGAVMGRPPQPPALASQDSFRAASQQSMQSIASERSFGPGDSTYGTMSTEQQTQGDMEPPRKRMRPSSQEETPTQGNGVADVSMRDGTPTEPNESFVYHQAAHYDGDVPIALPPLPPPGDKETEDKQAVLLDLFADLSRTDFSTHPAIQSLSGSDLDLPLDQSANTALHWAATLARVSLMRLLISKGASIFRGNAAGQTPLMAAVQVNNSLDHSCFPELLEILGPLIEVRDAQGRTILHHIAVACGINGRSASSKYYLEALLEFLVRSNSGSSGQGASFESFNVARPISLIRFMSEIVNAQDKAGNTALNLVARIGNRRIIRQLMEVQADPRIPNHKGLRPIDFGVGEELPQGGAVQSSSQPNQVGSPTKSTKTTLSRVEEASRDMMPSMSSFLSQTESQFSAEIRLKQDQIDATNTAIRELSALQKSELRKLEALQRRMRTRTDRQQRIANLRRAIDDQRARLLRSGVVTDPSALANVKVVQVGEADQMVPLPKELMAVEAAGADESRSPQISPAVLKALPPPAALRSRLEAYAANKASLLQKSQALKARNGELERQYRRVVSLCTGVDESRVEDGLGMLVQAVESEASEGVEIGRVREFLKKVEGVEEV
ncbi:transcriptional regulator swi6 [Coniosporium tulheliwenetii]|uniref:Transcriptional regulator swi6 n=1 Tax=Coniosporium tulheliwenetii TaxID=3383036 RepID=A0ACC2YNM3_9PEZI|nr:transcriptional regulator swi6 [Cladosporium sp. JES 115]